MTRRLMVTLVSGGLAWGCGGGPDVPEDDDFERHVAKPMPLNKVFTDSVSYNGNDRSDWKLINVEEPGLLQVTVRFDKQGARCQVQIADKYGAKMAREDNADQPRLELVRKVSPGRFFIWIRALNETCNSQYSLEARLDPD